MLKVISFAKRKKGFGNIVDIIQNIMFLQVVFCAMITVYYIRFQSGKTDFQPYIYLLISFQTFFIIILETYVDEFLKLAAGETVFVLLLSYIVPISNEKIWFILSCVILCMRSLYNYKFIYSNTVSYSQRYRTINRSKIQMAAIIVLFFIHVWTSDKWTDELINSSKICNYYMIASFAVFLMMMIVSKYAFKYYEYYRREQNEDEKTTKQLMYSFIIIFAAAAIIIFIIFIFFGGIITPIISGLIDLILKLFFSVLLKIFNIDLQGNRDDIVTQLSTSVVDVARLDKVTREDSPIASIVPYFLLMIGIGAVLYLVWSIYKNILSNYITETDNVEFVSIKKTLADYEKSEKNSSKVRFGKNNNDKIRKYYYNSVIKNSKKYNISLDNTKTPVEIKDSLPQNIEEKGLMKELTDIYETARYSNKNLTDADVDKAKNLNVHL